jgi:2-polyprenyl-6-methoxyphenol hydroxylase-like FAD-dependent oxidoreductase
MDFAGDVAIIGAGPVGMALALALAERGHSVVMLEQRASDQQPQIKANHVSARSMEVFRRLGVADAVRRAGLPSEFPHDVCFRTAFAGMELGRIHIPCARDRFSDKTGPDGGWLTAEPAHRINQIFLEPVLRRALAQHASITALFETTAEVVSQNQEHASISARTASGQQVGVVARFAIGCEGASSLMRHTMGAEFHGDAVVQRTRSTYIDAPGLLSRLRSVPAWGNFSFNRRRSGMVYAIDGIRRWLVHDYLADHEHFEDLDAEANLRAILGVESLAGIAPISTQQWTGRRMLADRFRSGRLFICGDAAHIWVPFGGYGMNAGIADAESLAWCLAADLERWGGPRVLDAYEAERMPITEQVSKTAMDKAIAVASDRQAVPGRLDEPGAEGDAVRREFGKRVYERNVDQYCAEGLNFGYYYSDSPAIVEDDETPPPYTMGHYEPSAVPGARFPHLWLEAETRSLYDLLGPGFTLLSVSGEFHNHVEQAAAQLKIPLRTVRLPQSVQDEPWFDHDMYLVRQDTHVVWRGSGSPSAIKRVLQRVSGWG